MINTNELEMKKFVSSASNLFEDVAESHENAKDVFKTEYSILNYGEILDKMAEFVDGYCNYAKGDNKKFDGKVTALFGTHTHVQTADEQILENGTGYITDIGMTGPKKSVIGMDPDASIKRFVTSLPERYKLAEGECIFNGCIFEINDENCRVNKIERVFIR
jgi:hypothetical protein